LYVLLDKKLKPSDQEKFQGRTSIKLRSSDTSETNLSNKALTSNTLLQK